MLHDSALHKFTIDTDSILCDWYTLDS